MHDLAQSSHLVMLKEGSKRCALNYLRKMLPGATTDLYGTSTQLFCSPVGLLLLILINRLHENADAKHWKELNLLFQRKRGLAPKMEFAAALTTVEKSYAKRLGI